MTKLEPLQINGTFLPSTPKEAFMPLVQIRSRLTDLQLSELLPGLQKVAAEALACEEGKLGPGDIMIEIFESHPQDFNTKDVNIRVFANTYPDRSKNLDDRRRQIGKYVQSHIPEGLTWYVWVKLSDASYGSDTIE